MKQYLSILFLCLPLLVNAQRVGLVFSGGGAKGLAHVGVLKALEENEIPVDYIVGTSMGGIIGGCYAAGMSPAQIEAMVMSEEFIGWINGSYEKGFNYYYHLSENDPHFLRVNLSLDSTLNVQLNTSLASDVSLNFALAEKLAQASAVSRNRFDSLFVPLRVMASDVFTQNEVTLSRGSLSDALRATQTVPFFYNPIRVDGKYLFDGGVYNNFPVDVMQKNFSPDVILGVNVSTKIFNDYPYENDEKLVSTSLLYMLLDKSDPTQIPPNGVYIQPNLKGFTSFDFGRVRSLIDSGYVQTIRQIDEIKAKISRRVTCDAVAESRNHFNSRNFPMRFDAIQYKGFNSKQRKYINRIFKVNPVRPRPMYYEDIKKGYFKLVSEQYFNNAYPNIYFDSLKRTFQLQLTRRSQKNFQVDFGGVIATRDISNIFLGLNYYNFDNTLLHAYLGFQTGNFYKSIVAKTRIDFPFQFYIEPKVIYNGWNYIENEDLLQKVATPTVLKRISRTYGVDLGFPLGNYFKTAINVDGINDSDSYTNDQDFRSTDVADRLSVTGLNVGITFSSSTLNRKQYASAGRAFLVSGNFFNVRENYVAGNTSPLPDTRARHEWLRVKASAEQYFDAGWFQPGYFAEAVFSNQSYFRNYFGTIINAPAFLPIQDSRTLILQNFRAFNYIGGGVRNVFHIRKRLDFRLEGYLFKPFKNIQDSPTHETTSNVDLQAFYLAGTAGFVFHSPIGPVSLSVNYYDDKENDLGILLHVGFLLFNKHPFE